jgi:hypothetical protein
MCASLRINRDVRFSGLERIAWQCVGAVIDLSLVARLLLKARIR